MSMMTFRWAMWPAVLLLMMSVARSYGQSGEAARRVFELTNVDRQAHGLSPLRWDPALAAAARAHAEWMVREGELSHQYRGESELMVRAAQAGAHFQTIAENIAVGQTPDGLEVQWMHSPPHRRNILDPRMNAIGIAVLERGGSLYAVQDFSEASQVLSATQIERRVRELLRRYGVNSSEAAGDAREVCRGDAVPRGNHARAVVQFETPDLTRLPAQAVSEIRNGRFRYAAVGACAPRGDQGNFTMYRVALLLY